MTLGTGIGVAGAMLAAAVMVHAMFRALYAARRPRQLASETEQILKGGICPACGSWRCPACHALIINDLDHAPGCAKIHRR